VALLPAGAGVALLPALPVATLDLPTFGAGP
jgi:hypothetical protein